MTANRRSKRDSRSLTAYGMKYTEAARQEPVLCAICGHKTTSSVRICHHHSLGLMNDDDTTLMGLEQMSQLLNVPLFGLEALLTSQLGPVGLQPNLTCSVKDLRTWVKTFRENAIRGEGILEVVEGIAHHEAFYPAKEFWKKM